MIGAAAWMAPALAQAAAPPTGSKPTIALARAEARAYRSIPAMTFRRTGLVQLTDAQGSSSYLYFTWGYKTLRGANWSWATEHATLRLRHGLIVWWSDQLTPPPCTQAGPCYRIPVLLVGERRGAYWAFGSAANHTCFTTLHQSTPILVGGLADYVEGHYSAPVLGRGTVAYTELTPWGKTGTARQIVTDSSRTHLTIHEESVTPGGDVFASDRYSRQAPPAPRVNLCPAG